MMAGIVLLGAILYANTLQVPWYMDDINNILDNQAVQSMGNAWQDLFTSARGLVNLTFAVNYAWGGDQVLGFHLVNIAIHLLTSCLVFLLLKRVFRQNVAFAVGGALIFLAHPLQTQAVTYIVQRATSLAALSRRFCPWRSFYLIVTSLPARTPCRGKNCYACSLPLP
ncbi:MAG: hypothetical protein P8Y96_13305 [Desulfuromonadales bacterium]